MAKRAPERSHIPIGRSNAISRAQLSGCWGCSDRVTRHIIANFRAEHDGDGYAILSSAHDPAGYWRSADPEEIAAFIRENEARARNTFLALHEAKRILSELQHKGQTAFDLYGEVSG